MGFFRTTASDEMFERAFFLSIIQSVREHAESPDFSELNLKSKIAKTLSVKNAKPGVAHIASVQFACSLLALETPAREVAAISAKAIVASNENDASAFTAAIVECQEWFSRHGVGFGPPLSVADLVAKLKSGA